MHGPRVPMGGGLRKAYLVSLMDDASRLITHSAFCPGETALDIEGGAQAGGVEARTAGQVGGR